MNELQQQKIKENTERFLGLCRAKIHREGLDKLLNWLQESDFFAAPASTRYHGDFPGGLAEHSLNVYDCLVDYLARPRVKEEFGLVYSEESVAVVALFHDLCKVNFYKTEKRNKKIDGVWQEVEVYTIDDKFPFGHGEKSVYMVQSFMPLKREEALAIRWHMGFSGQEDSSYVGQGLAAAPLAVALSVADEEATFFMESKKHDA